MKLSSVVFFVTIAAMLAMVGTSVFAEIETGENITLSPVKKAYNVKAGQVVNDTVTVLNNGQTDYEFRLHTSPYGVKDENYTPDYDTKRPNTDLSNWLRTEKSTYRLKSGQKVEVPFSISVPAGAAPGGHYGVLMAETIATGIVRGTGIKQQKRVGALMFLAVDGKYRTSGQVLEESAAFFQFNPPLQAKVRVKNTGNMDFLTKQSTTVHGLFGNKLHTHEQEVSVLPETTRAIPFSWQGARPFGIYRVDMKTEFLETSKTTTNYVVMAPMWFYLIVPLALLGAIVYLVQRRR